VRKKVDLQLLAKKFLLIPPYPGSRLARGRTAGFFLLKKLITNLFALYYLEDNKRGERV